MAGRRTGGLGKGLDALIPNKAGGPSKEPAKKTRSAVVKKDKPTEKDNPAAERLVKISSVEPNLNQPEDILMRMRCWNFRNPLNSTVFFSRCWYPIRRIILRSLQANAAGELPRWQGSRKFLLL